jgi:hypothetical protein
MISDKKLANNFFEGLLLFPEWMTVLLYRVCHPSNGAYLSPFPFLNSKK